MTKLRTAVAASWHACILLTLLLGTLSPRIAGAAPTPPVSQDDNHSVIADTPLAVAAPGVLANDHDAENDVLTVSLVNGPAHGVLTLHADGAFEYVPAPGYHGTDSFSYLANDGTADGNVATVQLNVESGKVFAFGVNLAGESGVDPNSGSVVVIPSVVAGLGDVIQIVAGTSSSLALRADGVVFAWGNNDYGQLGDGSTVSRFTPEPVTGLNNVVAITTGGYTSLAVRQDGTVWAWGLGTRGQLGNGVFGGNSSTPVQVQGLNNVTAVAAGNGHMVALRDDGTVWAWGYGADNRLGENPPNNVDRSLPQQVAGLSGVTAIAAGEAHNLALLSDGTVWGWGHDFAGQLGDGPVPAPGLTQASGLANVIAVSCGALHSIALKSDGSVWIWGLNDDGQLGDGTLTPQNVPVLLNGLSGIRAISAGGYHSHAIDTAARVWSWGDNSTGQLGLGLLGGGAHLPTLSSLPAGITRVSAGYFHSLAMNGALPGGQPTATSLTIVSSLNPASLGQSVSFTGTISPGIATGTVTFMDGSTLLASVPLVAGQATFVTSTLSAGAHSINAVYSGTSAYLSSSATLTQTISSGGCGTDTEPPVITCAADVLIVSDRAACGVNDHDDDGWSQHRREGRGRDEHADHSRCPGNHHDGDDGAHGYTCSFWNRCVATGVVLTPPTATDNCTLASVVNNHPSTSYPLGETLVTWTATDASGNTSTCVQKVTVIASVEVSFRAPLARKPTGNTIRRGQVVPFKVELASCLGVGVRSGVTVKLQVQGIDSVTGAIFQDVIEDASGMGTDGTVTSDGLMQLRNSQWQFNLDTGNFGDPNTVSGSRYYRATVTVIDNTTLAILGLGTLNLETGKR